MAGHRPRWQRSVIPRERLCTSFALIRVALRSPTGPESVQAPLGPESLPIASLRPASRIGRPTNARCISVRVGIARASTSSASRWPSSEPVRTRGGASAVSLTGYGNESSTSLVRARCMTPRRTHSSPERELAETSLTSGLPSAEPPESLLDLLPSTRRALIQWTSMPYLKHSKMDDGTSTIPPDLLQGRPSCALPPVGMPRTLPSLL